MIKSFSQSGFLLHNDDIRIIGPAVFFPREVLHWNVRFKFHALMCCCYLVNKGAWLQFDLIFFLQILFFYNTSLKVHVFLIFNKNLNELSSYTHAIYNSLLCKQYMNSNPTRAFIFLSFQNFWKYIFWPSIVNFRNKSLTEKVFNFWIPVYCTFIHIFKISRGPIPP